MAAIDAAKAHNTTKIAASGEITSGTPRGRIHLTTLFPEELPDMRISSECGASLRLHHHFRAD
jgi:hypothetical protein